MFDENEPAAEANGAAETNVSADTKREWYRKALQADIAQQSAKATFDSKKGEYRTVLKAAEKAGCDIEAITNNLAKRFQDPDEVLRAEIARIEMYEISGFLPGIADQLSRRARPAEGTLKETREGMLLDAYDKGALAGRQGRKLGEVNTYHPGSELHVRFIEGWREGQSSIAQEMAPLSDEPAQPAKRGRGRPKKAVTPAPEASAADVFVSLPHEHEQSIPA